MERQLVERDMRRNVLYEKVTTAPSFDELEQELTTWQNDLAILEQAFPSSAQIQQWKQNADALRRELEDHLRARPDDERALAIKGQVLSSRRLLEAFAEEQQQRLHEKLGRLQALLPSFERRQIAMLETTVRGPFAFVPTLDTLRAAALKIYEEIDEALNTTRIQIETVQRSLQSDNPLLTTVAQNAADLGRCEQAIDTVRQQYRQFAAQSGVFEGWLDLTLQATQTADELHGSGSEASKNHARFDQWVHTMSARLAGLNYATLAPPTELQQELHMLQEEVRRASVEAAERFLDLQTRYRQAIATGLGLTDAALWPLHHHNPQTTAEGDNAAAGRCKNHSTALV
ncbi:MAG: hypothetical protein MI924_03355 [Chloroflexales bacterium]|nr:hypothetical protein [Chloroflexales bacterium]